jgi:hypothetical protein
MTRPASVTCVAKATLLKSTHAAKRQQPRRQTDIILHGITLKLALLQAHDTGTSWIVALVHMVYHWKAANNSNNVHSEQLSPQRLASAIVPFVLAPIAKMHRCSCCIDEQQQYFKVHNTERLIPEAQQNTHGPEMSGCSCTCDR